MPWVNEDTENLMMLLRVIAQELTEIRKELNHVLAKYKPEDRPPKKNNK